MIVAVMLSVLSTFVTVPFTVTSVQRPVWAHSDRNGHHRCSLIVVRILLASIGSIVYTLLFVDLRNRREGTDIFERVSQLEACRLPPVGEDPALARLQRYPGPARVPVRPVAPMVGAAARPAGRSVRATLWPGSFKPWPTPTAGREGWFGLAFVAVCVVLFAVVLVYLVRAVRLSVTRDSRVGSARLADRRERSDRLWQTAQQLAAAGQLTEAVRLVYLSALYALDERALLHVESSLTNREHARQLSQMHPDLVGTFFGSRPTLRPRALRLVSHHRDARLPN